MALVLFAVAAVASAQDRSRTNEIDADYFREYQIAKMTCQEKAAPQNAIIVIPQYYYSSNSSTSIDISNVAGSGADNMKVGKSRGQGASIALAYNRKLSDTFSLTILYEYAFMAIRGGAVEAGGGGVWTKGVHSERNRWSSHIAAGVLDINLNDAGRFNFTLAQAWDRDSGHSRNTDHYTGGFNITVAQLWYEKDFSLCNNWTLTPYAGWRTIYGDLIANSHRGDHPAGLDDDVWIHLISGGLKLGYTGEKFGFHIRGGVNHRLTSDDLPSFGTRVTAPGVMHFAHRTNMDQTVGTYGIGITYPARDNLTFGLSYDGFAGKSTVAHMATLVGVLSF